MKSSISFIYDGTKWVQDNPTPPRSWSARIADAELVGIELPGIELPEPAEWEARGRFYPNVHALEDTTKDWIYQNGLHQPPAGIQINARGGGVWLNNVHVNGPLMIRGVSQPVSVQNSNFYGGGFVYTATVFPNYWQAPGTFNPPPTLPSEKREMPVVGYRAWKYSWEFSLGHGHQAKLSALNPTYGAWKKGVNQATCRTGAKHRAGEQHCQCGFYVLSDLEAATQWVPNGMADDVVVGAVMGWGQVVQHGEEGWRAEFARIIALLDCQFSPAQSKNLQTAAKAYGLEVKTREQLEAMVAEFGDPFPTPALPAPSELGEDE